MAAEANPRTLYKFWFGEGSLDDPKFVETRMKLWFGKDPETDRRMREDFAPWLEQDLAFVTPQDFLSLVILHDQVPRNAFRDTPEMFAYDNQARDLAEIGLSRGYQHSLHVLEALFLLLPFEHSENIEDQTKSVKLFGEVHARAPISLHEVTAGTYDYAKRHAAVIERFGRFPHRNDVLGRESSAEEVAFLRSPGNHF
jgi:uncharacterized protein (DUF924 family)